MNSTKKEKKERFKLLKKIREYWKIPRYHALMILGLYFLFFGLIFLYTYITSIIHTSIEEPEVVIDAVTALTEMDNYEYYYEIESTGIEEISSYTISGIRYGEQDNFKISNDSFYVQNNIIYSTDGSQDITDIVPIDLLMLRPTKIYEFIKGSTNANKIEYQNGEIKITYTVPVSIFNIAFLQTIDENNSETVEIITYEKDNQIYQIDLDIYNLMKLVDASYESYTIRITYTNINNIKKVEELSVE